MQKPGLAVIAASIVLAAASLVAVLPAHDNEALALHVDDDPRAGHPSIPVYDKNNAPYSIPLFLDTRQLEFHTNLHTDYLNTDMAYVVGHDGRGSFVVELGGSTYTSSEDGSWTKYVLTLARGQMASVKQLAEKSQAAGIHPKFGLKPGAVFLSDSFVTNHRVEHTVALVDSAGAPPAPNAPPALEPIRAQAVGEGETLTVHARAEDPDGGQSLTYSITGGASHGATIAGNTFAWTPTESQGPGTYSFYITVTDDGSPPASHTRPLTVTVSEVNLPPVLAEIGPKPATVGVPLTIALSATDADLPANTLTYSGNATFGTLSGSTFTWTPAQSDVNTHAVRFTVSDGNGGADHKDATITVSAAPNAAPRLEAMKPKTVGEGRTLSFPMSASDPDGGQSLTYSITGGASHGATIAGNTFAWTPTESQGPGTYSFYITVTDDGSPPASHTRPLTVTVSEVNLPPVLVAVGNKSTSVLEPLTFTAAATDADRPSQTLRFFLAGTPPDGASITAQGAFAWTPAETQNGTHLVAVAVTDGIATVGETIAVTVGPRQSVTPANLVSGGSFEDPAVTAHGGTWQLIANGTAGLGWTVENGDLELQRGILGGASDGAQHAELDGRGSVTISQVLDTEPGGTYAISFDYKARPDTPRHSNGLQATWNGADIAPGIVLGGDWQTLTVEVLGTGSDVIAFSDTGTSDGVGTFLDGVSVALVDGPEPPRVTPSSVTDDAAPDVPSSPPLTQVTPSNVTDDAAPDVPSPPPQQPQQRQDANLVSGGSFEDPAVTAHGGTWQLLANGTAGLGWTVENGDLELQRGILGGASDGAQHAELDGRGSVTISQVLDTEPGGTYAISFDYKARPDTPRHSNGLQATWNGADIAPGIVLGGDWQTLTVEVLGTGSDVIAFSDTGTSDGVGTFLDGVSVALVDGPQQQHQQDAQRQITPSPEPEPVPASDPLTLSVSNAHAAEGGYLEFNLTLNKPFNGTIDVYYITIDGVAIAGLDYLFETDMVTFKPGQTQRTVPIRTLADGVNEGPEAMQLEITIADGARIGNHYGTGTIRD